MSHKYVVNLICLNLYTSYTTTGNLADLVDFYFILFIFLGGGVVHPICRQ